MCFVTLAFTQFPMPQVLAQNNLILNGTFDEELAGSWRVYGAAELFPKVERRREASGNFYLHMDTPSGTEAYVEQGPIRIPATQKALLTFLVWGAFEATIVWMDFVVSGKVCEIDVFWIGGLEQLNGTRMTKIYDVTNYSGRSISLRLGSTSPFNLGTVTAFDDIQLLTASPRGTLVTCQVRRETPDVPEATIAVGEHVVVEGETYPSYSGPLLVTYRRPDSTIALRETIQSTISGTYSHTYAPERPGIWTVQVSLPGASPRYEAGASPIVYFAVTSTYRLELIDAVVNDRRLDISAPKIEVKPGENITGSIRIRAPESLRFTNFVVVGFNSWEPGVWDLILFERGLIDDPSGLESKDAFLVEPSGISVKFFPRDRNLGLYAVDHTWTFPQPVNGSNEVERDVNEFYLASGHPSFRAPLDLGEYFLVIIQGGQNTATDLIRSVQAFSRFDWQEHLPPTRADPLILAISITVVDVDPHMRDAVDEINRAKRNYVNVTAAEMKYTEALAEYVKGHYSEAITQADEAHKLAKEAVDALESLTRSRADYLGKLSWLSEYVVSMTDNRETVRSKYESMIELLSQEEYGRAKILGDEMENVFARSLVAYIGLYVALWFGIGDLAAHWLSKRKPLILLANLFDPALSSTLKNEKKRRRYCELLAALVLYFVTWIIQEVIGSAFPSIGNLVLATSVFGGWHFEILHRLSKRLRMLRLIKKKLGRATRSTTTTRCTRRQARSSTFL